MEHAEVFVLTWIWLRGLQVSVFGSASGTVTFSATGLCEGACREGRNCVGLREQRDLRIVQVSLLGSIDGMGLAEGFDLSRIVWPAGIEFGSRIKRMEIAGSSLSE
jgi:hypothetical protein